MRVLHCGDLHISNRGTLAGKYVIRNGVNLNLADKILSIRGICEYAEEHKLDLIVIAGDLFNESNPESLAIKVAVEAIERLAEQAPAVIVRGNHDGKTEIASALSMFGKSQRRFGIYVSERPEIISILSKQRKIQVFTLPYPLKSALSANPQYKNLSPEELSVLIGRKMEEILSGFTAQFDKDAVNILVGHFTVSSGKYSREQVVPPFDISIRKEFLEKFDLALLGHLHEPQEYYCGTIARNGFGEEGMKVGFKVHELTGSERREEFVELAARQYRTIPVEEFMKDGSVPFGGLDLETVIRIKGKIPKWQYQEAMGKMKALSFPFIKNAIEVESDTVRVSEGEMSDEPSVEEAVRIWAKGKDGVDKFIDSLVNVTKDIEFKWRTEKGV
jgi:exonuclease SbcD